MRLFDVLKARGVKKKWLAEQLNLTPNYLRLVERGKRRLSLAKRDEASKLLGVAEEELFSDVV